MRVPTRVVIAALVGTFSSTTQAQTVEARDSVRWAAVAQLRPGNGVRLHTAELGRLQGRFLSLTDSAVILEGTPTETKVALAGIDSLWQRGSAVNPGAIGGAIIGGILGGGKGAAIGSIVGADAGTGAVAAGGRNAATLPSGTPVTVRVHDPVVVTVER